MEVAIEKKYIGKVLPAYLLIMVDDYFFLIKNKTSKRTASDRFLITSSSFVNFIRRLLLFVRDCWRFKILSIFTNDDIHNDLIDKRMGLKNSLMREKNNIMNETIVTNLFICCDYENLGFCVFKYISVGYIISKLLSL